MFQICLIWLLWSSETIAYLDPNSPNSLFLTQNDILEVENNFQIELE